MMRATMDFSASSKIFRAPECAASILFCDTCMSGRKKDIEKTEDGHYIIIDGRKWRATNPNLPEAERQKWVHELMSARRAVGQALKAKDPDAQRAARERVQTAKVALGERGPKWWQETDSDGNAKNAA